MNCKQFNSISLDEVLLAFGHLPTKQNEKEAWYLNPFASESQASFKWNKNLNYWYLFSEGIGGNNIDFAKKYLHTTVGGVLEWADAQRFSSFHHQLPGRDLKPNYKIDDILNIENPNLKKYLHERGLSSNIYKYIREVHFTMGQKKLYAIGFEYLSGGIELRNSFYKGSFLKKDISIFAFNSDVENAKDVPPENRRGVSVFEGFIDALSFIELQKSFVGDVLVMNSIALLKRSMEHLKNYSPINLFLDNDNAGMKCKSEILKSFPEAKDYSGMYSEHKDLNEFLVHKIKNQEIRNHLAQRQKYPDLNRVQDKKRHEPEIKNAISFKRKL